MTAEQHFSTRDSTQTHGMVKASRSNSRAKKTILTTRFDESCCPFGLAAG